ncbi:DUF2690 domain-containing protein [Streptomyces sp. NPDC046985]|uniref:helix-turn-helix domain-containing protein n=1 Tax=Streptomyces sp. NPDC046985 TaxID=3155377 RepID=UPI00340A86CC
MPFPLQAAPQSAQQAAPSTRPLAAALSELRSRTGLSLAALAARTPYSKSAWHRYLTGAKRPPRSAVEALARLADADPAPALALWDAADETTAASADVDRADVQPSGAEPSPAEPGGAEPGDPVAARTRRQALAPTLALLASVALVVAALAASSLGGASAARRVSVSPRCQVHSCQGGLPGASVCAADARTESAARDAAYTVRLRWSPSCRVAWSQVAVRGGGARKISVRTRTDVLSARYSAGDARGDTSPMLAVRSPRGVEACAEVRGEVACTGLDEDAGEDD